MFILLTKIQGSSCQAIAISPTINGRGMAFENLYLIVLLTDTKKLLNSLRIETFGKANMIKYGRTIRYTLYPGFFSFPAAE